MNLQTRGGYSGHLEALRRKGIASCGRIAVDLPLTQMSLKTLERLLLTVVLPSATYGLELLAGRMRDQDYDYISEVQGRLLKAWFGVSKYSSTSSLMGAAGWRPAGPLVKEYYMQRNPIRVSVSPSSVTCTGSSRRNMGAWFANGLHNLWCVKAGCYNVNDSCVCKLCNTRNVHKAHLMECDWARANLKISAASIDKAVRVLYAVRIGQHY